MITQRFRRARFFGDDAGVDWRHEGIECSRKTDYDDCS
jgi:hypothetical protein